MKKLLVAILTLISFYSCSSDKDHQMTVKGTVSGLMKGTLYLQKAKDTVIVSVDSVYLDGTNNFELKTIVESPEVYYLGLNNSNFNEKIPFFGEKGTVVINTRLDRFSTAFKITGGKNQQLLMEYQEMIKKFNDRQLELIERNFKAAKVKNNLLGDQVKSEYNDLLKRRYLYTANFAVQHADCEIAPYLALSELYNANVNLLDTINNALSENIKKSKYGNELNLFIKKIKAEK